MLTLFSYFSFLHSSIPIIALKNSICKSTQRNCFRVFHRLALVMNCDDLKPNDSSSDRRLMCVFLEHWASSWRY